MDEKIETIEAMQEKLYHLKCDVIALLEKYEEELHKMKMKEIRETDTTLDNLYTLSHGVMSVKRS